MDSVKLIYDDLTINLHEEKEPKKVIIQEPNFIDCVYENRIGFRQTSYFKIEEIYSYERLLYLIIKDLEHFYDKISIMLCDVYLLYCDESDSDSNSDEDKNDYNHNLNNFKVRCRLDCDNFKDKFNLEDSDCLFLIKVNIKEEIFSDDEMQRDAQKLCDLFMTINHELNSFEMKKEPANKLVEDYSNELITYTNLREETQNFIKNTFSEIKNNYEFKMKRQNENFDLLFKFAENSFNEWLNNFAL